MSVRENIELPLKIAKVNKVDRKKRVEQILELCRLGELIWVI